MTDQPPDFLDQLEVLGRKRVAAMSDEELQRFAAPADSSDTDSHFRADTPMSECVAVVVSPDHVRFGQVADIRAHDWKEYGNLYLEFDDGHLETFRDGLISDETIPPEALIYPRSDQAGIDELLARLPEIKAKLRRLFHDCYNLSQLREGRLHHRRNFFAVLHGEEAQLTLPV